MSNSAEKLLTFLLIGLWSFSFASEMPTQKTEPELIGTIYTSKNMPAEGAHIVLQGVGGRQETQTAKDGSFSFRTNSRGQYSLTARWGGKVARTSLNLEPGHPVAIELFLNEEAPSIYEGLVVSATGEHQILKNVPLAIHTLDAETIKENNPVHPSDIMGRISGAWVNVTGGEGHMTAIRQPLTTNPVYLYLENGVPIRSTGFFNHNALYEVNLPMAGTIEVIKGPGSALHGSDAVGGVVQVNTRRIPLGREIEARLEGGELGLKKALISYGDKIGEAGVLFDLNATDSEGWQDHTEYQRQTGSLQWMRSLGPLRLQALASFSKIDQNTAGSSAISEEDYFENPRINYAPISLRKVQAVRLSVNMDMPLGNGHLNLIPYGRNNEMELLPNWSLTYDPTIYEVQNDSLGLISKYTHFWDFMDSMLIVGMDLDYSPGSRVENRIETTRDGKIFTSYRLGSEIYNYDVTFQGNAAYLHGECSPTQALRFQLGIRHDQMNYDYQTHLAPVATGRWRRPEDTRLEFRQTSPKLGMTWQVNDRLSLFASHRHAFRAPSEGQLFRQGSSDDTLGLDPVKARNTEVGMRGKPISWADLQITAYRLIKSDDILSYQDPVTGWRESVNAGLTSHKGIEMDLRANLTEGISFELAASYAEHRYEDWTLNGTISYSGNEMESAPRFMGNLVLQVEPERLFGHALSLEWRKLGSYWLDPANTFKYKGHDLLSLRWSYAFYEGFEAGASIRNLGDTLFAERASYNAFRGREYAPGMPRNLVFSLKYKWN